MRIATTLRLLVLASVIFVMTLAAAGPGLAVRPDEILPDPKLEARARALSHELRCMVCQNESIDDSEAPLAHDLRVLVRERLTMGDTDQQVLDFLVARYGEFVLLKPRFEWQTLPLWLAPAALLGIGGLTMLVAIRRRRPTHGRAPEAPAPLSENEQARLAEITGAEQG